MTRATNPESPDGTTPAKRIRSTGEATKDPGETSDEPPAKIFGARFAASSGSDEFIRGNFATDEATDEA